MQEANPAASDWNLKQAISNKAMILAGVGLVLVIILCMPEVEVKGPDGGIIKVEEPRQRFPQVPEGLGPFLHESVAKRVADWRSEGSLYYGYDYSGRLINILDYQPAPNIITPFNGQTEIYYVYGTDKARVIIKKYEPSWRAGSLGEQEHNTDKDSLVYVDIYDYDIANGKRYLMQAQRFQYDGRLKLISQYLRNNDYSVRQVRYKEIDHPPVPYPGRVTEDGWTLGRGDIGYELWDRFGDKGY